MANHILQIVYPCLPESPFPALDQDFDKPSYSSVPPAGGEDRISALPDDLLRNIFSRLRVKDAGRAAATSPRWRHIWRSTPCALEDRHLIRQLDLQDGVDWTALAAAVSRVLLAHPGPFRWVHLTWNFMGSQEEALANWLRLFAAKGVENLVLVNDLADCSRLPAVPSDVLRCASLRRLFLGFWRFRSNSAAVPPADGFPHLLELTVFGTHMPGHSLDHLLASSPALGTLALVLSRTRERVHLQSLSLKCVLLWHYSTQEVVISMDSPLLERLILWKTLHDGDDNAVVAMRVKIDGATKLRLLGYLDMDIRVHQLQIGDNVIQVSTTL
jgi:hypothetical protein